MKKNYDSPKWMAQLHLDQPAVNVDIRCWMATTFMAAMLTNPELDPQQMPKRAVQMATALMLEIDKADMENKAS